MTEDRFQRVHDLFTEATDRAPEQRASFLDSACKDDPELRREVESMLKHHEVVPEDFLRPPELDALMRPAGTDTGPDPRVGTTLGAYKIKSVIASGGMGTVYLAEQASPRRDVALKVMRGGIASRSALRRFEYESQILARLRHPNIAQVYEAGTHPPSPSEGEGRGEGEGHSVPYFAMEYIPDARPITQYAAQERLSTRRRLELFAQVCDAVHHGHQKGIIHRDLKPANILVASSEPGGPVRQTAPGAPVAQTEPGAQATGRPLAGARGSDRGSPDHGQVKIIDFGVARSTDSDIALTTLQTDVGQIIGTLQYMSPEQCTADPHEIDTRSDVYALGVVLYELLCGQLPYDVRHTAIHEAARVISEEPPTPPSTITGRSTGLPPVDRNLETIAMKTLEKDRERRYQSAADLTQDIRRYLNGDPIEARPPTAWTRTLRWVARHPIIATAATCMAVALLILATTSITAWYYSVRPHVVARYRSGLPVKPDDRQPVDEARLLTLSGHPLRTWGGETGSVVFTELVARSDKLGGGRLALIGYTERAKGKHRGSLCAYDVGGDWEVPVWTKRIETKNLLDELRVERSFTSEQFTLSKGAVADVFPGPDCPGDEIVAIFSEIRLSQRVIRIYDLRGKLLYQVWHEGGVDQPYWMSGPRLLVLIGDNARLNWDRGRLLRAEPNPFVVFALRPVRGHINDTNFLNDPDCLPVQSGGSPGNPVWYKYLYIDKVPASSGDVTRQRLEPPSTANHADFVHLDLCLVGVSEAGIGWTIDEFGDEVPETRAASDSYKIDQKSPDRVLPDPNAFKLDPLPPIVTTSQPAVTASPSPNTPAP